MSYLPATPDPRAARASRPTCEHQPPMTFRARPTTKPTTRRRGTHAEDARRNLYFNLGFGLIVVVAILAARGSGAGHLDQPALGGRGDGERRVHHQGPAQRPGQDRELQAQRRGVAHQAERAGEPHLGRPGTAGAPVHRPAAAADQQRRAGRRHRHGAHPAARDQAGRGPTDAAITAQVTTDATTVESRHVLPDPGRPGGERGRDDAHPPPRSRQPRPRPTACSPTSRPARPGRTWSRSRATRPPPRNNGDLLFINKGSTTPDEAFVNAIFALAAPGYTDVIQGSDGTFRIGRLTEIAPAQVDATYTQRIAAAGISLDAYRRVDSAIVVAV